MTGGLNAWSAFASVFGFVFASVFGFAFVSVFGLRLRQKTLATAGLIVASANASVSKQSPPRLYQAPGGGS